MIIALYMCLARAACGSRLYATVASKVISRLRSWQLNAVESTKFLCAASSLYRFLVQSVCVTGPLQEVKECPGC